MRSDQIAWAAYGLGRQLAMLEQALEDLEHGRLDEVAGQLRKALEARRLAMEHLGGKGKDRG